MQNGCHAHVGSRGRLFTLVNTRSSTMVWDRTKRGDLRPATCPDGPRVSPKLHHCLLSVTFASLRKAGLVTTVLEIEVAWPVIRLDQTPETCLLPEAGS